MSAIITTTKSNANMPQALPKNRPGTKLQGIDRLLSKVWRTDAPDRSGRTLGLTWAAWRSDAGYKVYVMHGGELLKRPDLRRRRKRYKYHLAADKGDILRVLWKLYWRERDPETPLVDLQRFVRRQTNEKCRHQHYEQRHAAWLERHTVRSQERRGGGMMHSIK